MNVLKGFTYCVTASADTTVTDDNGLNLAVKAGEQGFFVASCDEVTVTGTCIIAQVRGNFNVPTALGGGGGRMDYFILTDAEQQPYKFYANLDNLEYLTDDLPQGWFKGNGTLTEWNVPLPNLKAGYGMFKGCTGLTGPIEARMVAKLTNGTSMFEGCTGITACTSALGYLEDGTDMFKGCTSFKVIASSPRFLVTAPGMFSGCKINFMSLQVMANTIKKWTDGGTHEITIGVDSNEVTQAQQNAANTTMTNRGWTVTWERN